MSDENEDPVEEPTQPRFGCMKLGCGSLLLFVLGIVLAWPQIELAFTLYNFRSDEGKVVFDSARQPSPEFGDLRVLISQTGSSDKQVHGEKGICIMVLKPGTWGWRVRRQITGASFGYVIDEVRVRKPTKEGELELWVCYHHSDPAYPGSAKKGQQYKFYRITGQNDPESLIGLTQGEGVEPIERVK